MPLIQVTMLEGKSIEQKRKLVDRLTTVTVEELGTARAAITVTIVEVPPANYASGGTLVLDRK